jgi:hypothetical protein
LEKPFPAGEKAIAQSAHGSWMYARDVLKAPFPLGEPAILRSEVYKPKYIEFLKKLGIDPDEYFLDQISSGELTAEDIYGT